ncbi:MAG: hypothetical protein KDJ19_05085 [Hyphomicrobiaceae bacterium]|nr:hypothetical protein [Hyphomicrobiaceae bacterium]MCC0024899.1 hypothetical protein [Hyphomicrobiaceae bacterium]
MTTFLVINNNDSGSGSLRQAILNAEESSSPGKDVIEFASWMSGQTIQLQSTLQIQTGKLSMNFDLDGDGLGDITLSGDNGTQGFYKDASDIGLLIQVGASANVSISSLNAVGGGENATQGDRAIAGIQNYGILTLTDSYMSHLKAYGGTNYYSGGNAISGIHNQGTLYVSNTQFNELRAQGGAGTALNLSSYTYGYNGGTAAVGIFNSGTGGVVVEQFNVSNARLFGGDGAGGSARNGAGGDTYLGVTTFAGSVAGDLGWQAAQNYSGDSGAGGAALQPPSVEHENRGTSGLVARAQPEFGTMLGDGMYSYGAGGVLIGLAGRDRLNDFGGGGFLYGGGGNDYILTKGANGKAYGGAGNDVIKNTSLLAITMNGGDGTDLLDVSQDIWNFEFNMVTGVAKTVSPSNSAKFFDSSALNFENVNGTNQIDKITGTNGANIIIGNDGDDILKGLGGNDQILGGKGDDDIRGGDANDILRGGNNTDTLRGDNGSDIVHGGSGADFLFGGNANDRLRGGDGSDELQGDRGNDVLRGGGGKDTFIFGKGFDKDSVRDFTDNTDQIALNDNLWKGTLSKTQILNQFATLKGNGDVVFDFGHGDIFTIKDAGSVAIFKNDMVII